MATTTKDNLQAHRFMNRRVRAALLEGDAESNTRPLARLGDHVAYTFERGPGS